MQVFTVDVSTLARTGFMRLTNVDTSVTKSVIINVLGSGTARFSNFFFNTAAVPQGLITWNICSADRVVIENFLFPGTITTLDVGQPLVLTLFPSLQALFWRQRHR
jgi:choice-of-anchor A domain-containing protein